MQISQKPAAGKLLLPTRQTEARLMEVAHRLMGHLLLLLLLLPDRGGLLGGHRRHHLRGQDHLTHRPVVLASGDSSQLCQLDAAKVAQTSFTTMKALKKHLELTVLRAFILLYT